MYDYSPLTQRTVAAAQVPHEHRGALVQRDGRAPRNCLLLHLRGGRQAVCDGDNAMKDRTTYMIACGCDAELRSDAELLLMMCCCRHPADAVFIRTMQPNEFQPKS